MTDVSFDQQEIILSGYGKEFAQTLTDTQGVFSSYTFDSGSVSYEQKGNQLTVWMEKSQGQNGQLTMDCFYPQQGTSIAYRSKYNHQAVGYITGGTPNQMHISAKVETGSIQLLKKDAQTGSVSQGDAHLAKAQYQLVDDQTKEVVGTFTIQEDLSSNRISDLPTDRTYTIQEVQAPQGYLLNTSKVQIDFSNQKDVTLEVSDTVITGRIQIKIRLSAAVGGQRCPGTIDGVVHGTHVHNSPPGVYSPQLRYLCPSIWNKREDSHGPAAFPFSSHLLKRGGPQALPANPSLFKCPVAHIV